MSMVVGGSVFEVGGVCIMGRGVVWCGVAWCGVVWGGVVWCGVVRVHRSNSRGPGTFSHNGTLGDTARGGPLERSRDSSFRRSGSLPATFREKTASGISSQSEFRKKQR